MKNAIIFSLCGDSDTQNGTAHAPLYDLLPPSFCFFFSAKRVCFMGKNVDRIREKINKNVLI